MEEFILIIFFRMLFIYTTHAEPILIQRSKQIKNCKPNDKDKDTCILYKNVF